MFGPQLGSEIGFLADDGGVLFTQTPDGIGLDGFRGGARIGAAALQALELLVTRLGLGGARLGGGQLVVQLGQLLLVDGPPAGADDVVLALVALDLFLRVPHAVAQLVEARRQRAGDAARSIRARDRPLVGTGPRGRTGGPA